MSNAEVASALVISELTVTSHIGGIFTKLGLRDRAAVIAYALDHAIVGPANLKLGRSLWCSQLPTAVRPDRVHMATHTGRPNSGSVLSLVVCAVWGTLIALIAPATTKPRTARFC